MNISVFGTGEVGTAVATKLKSTGHDTVFGSRHPGDFNTRRVIPAKSGILPERATHLRRAE